VTAKPIKIKAATHPSTARGYNASAKSNLAKK
jgi:hypothetical protein